MIKVVLIRHGKTIGNLNKAYIGKTDEPLCDEYIDDILKKEYPMVEKVFSSPLIRCIETAKHIYKDSKPQIINALRECDFGDFEGKNYEQLKGNSHYQKWLDSNGKDAFPNGEDGLEFRKRCQNGLEDIIKQCAKSELSEIAVVCHGGTIMAILDKYSFPHRDFYNWQVDNLCGFTFEYNINNSRAINIKKLWE